MVAPTVVDMDVNPNDSTQYVVLWGTGHIDVYGGVPPITGVNMDWYNRTDQPVGTAIHITNWATGAGYVLDIQGGFHALNGAPTITTVSGDTRINSNGLPYVLERRYVDWSWDPAGTGKGYAVDYYGELFTFGGAPAGTPAIFTIPSVKKLAMKWETDGTRRAYILDLHGAIWPKFSAVAPTPPPPYFRTLDTARDLFITNWTTGAGFLLTGDGATHPFGGAPSPLTGGPYRKDQDLARTFYVLSGSNPVKIRQIHAGGQVFDYYASTPPSAVAALPSATVTTTTRPLLGWNYTDPQKDSQAAYELLVFTAAFVAGNTMTDPAVHAASALVNEKGVDPAVRAITSPIDLMNGDYRFYVRVKDTADQWSSWSSIAWTQNVPQPATPTSMTATMDLTPGAYRVDLSAVTAGPGDYVRFEFSQDDGVTWTPVRGADSLPRLATTLGVDRDAPMGIFRKYRAVVFDDAPRVTSAPSNVAEARVDRYAHVLTSVADPALGGELLVTGAPSWQREKPGGIFDTLESEYATVVSAAKMRSRRQTLAIQTDTRADWQMVYDLVRSDSTLVYRDPFGDVMYCRIVGGFSRSQNWLRPYPEEETPLRHNHNVEIPLVEVRQPTPEIV